MAALTQRPIVERGRPTNFLKRLNLNTWLRGGHRSVASTLALAGILALAAIVAAATATLAFAVVLAAAIMGGEGAGGM